MILPVPSCPRPQAQNKLRILLLMAVLCCAASASQLRVATLNVEFGLGPPGSAAHGAARDILARIDADVVALQELDRADFAGAPTNLESLALSLGYPHVHEASTSNVLDLGMRSGFLSRYPLTATANIGSPAGALDMTRQIPAIMVDVPDTVADPTILTLHLKCCLEIDDPFRRAVELKRASDYLTSRELTGGDNIIILGDFNLIGNDFVYNSLPGGLPRSFALGDDVSFPVHYFIDPADYFQPWGISALDARQLDGSQDTQGRSRLDYILASPALVNRPHAGEVYNSSLDLNNQEGLPKTGLPLADGTSGAASDHLAVFADFNLTSPDSLLLQVTPPSIEQSAPGGTVILTVELPVAPGPGASVQVNLSSSNPAAAIPAQSTILFQPGERSLEVDVLTQPTGAVNGSQTVTFTATAGKLGPATAELLIKDATTAYYDIRQLGVAVTEDFNGFAGLSDHPLWPTSSGLWRGTDDGTSSVTGLYSYGTDGSLGFLIGSTPVTATARFRNTTNRTITALQVTYQAEQWRTLTGGRQDTITAEGWLGGTSIPLPGLTFTAQGSFINETNPGGRPVPRSTSLGGLSLAPGETMELAFTATRGSLPAGPVDQSARLNEFHYDNDGQDTGEFLELLLGPAFEGPLDEVEIHLYNGNGGRLYGQHNLASFSHDQTNSSGYRLFSKLVPGLQNGPDGIAVTVAGAVSEFLSYEGFFTAADGPAEGIRSRNIGVSQSGPVPAPGTGSLGLGQDLENWLRLDTHSRGDFNPGQELSSPGLPGIAIDEFQLIAMEDFDLDGLPDSLEPRLGTDPHLPDSDGDGAPDGEEDADRDGQSNLAEVALTRTDPLDANSRFQISVAPIPDNPDGVLVSFPTLPGLSYTISHSSNLEDWSPLLTLPGSGQEEIRAVTGDPAAHANLYRVAVTRSGP